MSRNRQLAGLGLDFSMEPNSRRGWVASKRAIAIENKSPVLLALSIPAQALTQAARELIPIAKLDATELEYLKEVAEALGTQCEHRYSAEYNSGLIQIHVGDIKAVSEKTAPSLASFTLLAAMCRHLKQERVDEIKEQVEQAVSWH